MMLAGWLAGLLTRQLLAGDVTKEALCGLDYPISVHILNPLNDSALELGKSEIIWSKRGIQQFYFH